MRISYYVQKISFTLALVVPLAVLGWPQMQTEIFFCVVYAWTVGIVAALWHRLTVTE